MSIFNPTRDQVRAFFCDTWKKHRDRLPMTQLELQAVDLLEKHPEYHAILESPEAMQIEYTPERGESNPFLHLSLHLAIVEQLSIDQPPGIRAAYQHLAAKRDAHAAEHILLDKLAEQIWISQREQRPLNPMAYVEAVRRAGSMD